MAEGVTLEVPEAPVADTTTSDTTSVENGMVVTEEVGNDTVEEAILTTAGMDQTGGTIEEINLKDHLTTWEYMVYKRTDYALGWSYILLIIAIILALAFPLITVATDMKAIVRLLAIVAGAAVLILVSYFVLASDTPIDILGYAGTDNKDPVTLKWIGTGLYSTYIIFGVALLSILYSEIAKLFK